VRGRQHGRKGWFFKKEQKKAGAGRAEREPDHAVCDADGYASPKWHAVLMG
jgi:hypothetical protein